MSKRSRKKRKALIAICHWCAKGNLSLFDEFGCWHKVSDSMGFRCTKRLSMNQWTNRFQEQERQKDQQRREAFAERYL